MKPPKNNYCRRPFWWWGSLYNNFSHFETKKKFCAPSSKNVFFHFSFLTGNPQCVCVCVLVYEWCAHIKKNLKFNSHFGCILGANLIQRKKNRKNSFVKAKQTNKQSKKTPFYSHIWFCAVYNEKRKTFKIQCFWNFILRKKKFHFENSIEYKNIVAVDGDAAAAVRTDCEWLLCRCFHSIIIEFSSKF